MYFIIILLFQQKNIEQQQAQQKSEEEEELNQSHTDVPLVENLNRLEDGDISASGIDAAVAALR